MKNRISCCNTGNMRTSVFPRDANLEHQTPFMKKASTLCSIYVLDMSCQCLGSFLMLDHDLGGHFPLSIITGGRAYIDSSAQLFHASANTILEFQTICTQQLDMGRDWSNRRCRYLGNVAGEGLQVHQSEEWWLSPRAQSIYYNRSLNTVECGQYSTPNRHRLLRTVNKKYLHDESVDWYVPSPCFFISSKNPKAKASVSSGEWMCPLILGVIYLWVGVHLINVLNMNGI